MSKTNKYGFIGNIPSQSSVNSGVYTTAEINSLIAKGQWTDLDAYDLLGYTETNVGTNVYLSLTGLDTTNYSNLKIIIDWQSTATGVMYGYIRFYDSSGVKTSGYYNAQQLLRSSTDLKGRYQNDSKSFTQESVAYGYPQSIMEINVANASSSDNETAWSWNAVSNGGGGDRLGAGQHRNLDYQLAGVDLYTVPESDATARIGAGTNISVYGYKG
jgi:hypothetical protein